MQNIVIWTWNTSLHGSQPSSVVFGCKTASFGPEQQVSKGTRHDLSFCECTTTILASELPVSMGPRPHLWFLDAQQRLWNRKISLYGSQTWNVLLCMQNSVIAPELLVSMGSSPHLWFCAFKRATLGPELHISMGPRPHLWLCACKTVCLASELLISMGSSPHLWLLHVKQRLLDKNNKSLPVPDLTCCFVHAKLRD